MEDKILPASQGLSRTLFHMEGLGEGEVEEGGPPCSWMGMDGGSRLCSLHLRRRVSIPSISRGKVEGSLYYQRRVCGLF